MKLGMNAIFGLGNGKLESDPAASREPLSIDKGLVNSIYLGEMRHGGKSHRDDRDQLATTVRTPCHVEYRSVVMSTFFVEIEWCLIVISVAHGSSWTHLKFTCDLINYRSLTAYKIFTAITLKKFEASSMLHWHYTSFVTVAQPAALRTSINFVSITCCW
jgi:hypothetical protein